MKAWLIRGVVVLAACASAAFAADPPRFRVTTVVPYGGYCSRAAAINEVGDVFYSSCGSLIVWDVGAQQPVALLAKAPATPGCISYDASGPFNSARQLVAVYHYLSRCGLGGGDTQRMIVYGVSTEMFDLPNIFVAIDGTGELAINYGGRYVISPDPADWQLTSSGAPGFVTALNDNQQALTITTFYKETNHASLVDLAAGTTMIFQAITSVASMNARGWVAGTDASTQGPNVVLWDGNSERGLGVPLGSDNGHVQVNAISKDGWILGNSDQGVWLWIDEAFYKLQDLVLTPLPDGANIQNAVGFSQSGSIAVNLAQPYGSNSGVLLLTPTHQPATTPGHRPQARRRTPNGRHSGIGQLRWAGWLDHQSRPSQTERDR